MHNYYSLNPACQAILIGFSVVMAKTVLIMIIVTHIFVDFVIFLTQKLGYHLT